MSAFDVFNGDADGILSLVQLRLSDPRPKAKLVTGRKRDIKLLDRVNAKKGNAVTVLDISMKSNADDLRRILDAGADVFYVDHHNAGDIPTHPNLYAIIDTSPEICTAMLVDDCLEGAHRAWAVTAAFGVVVAVFQWGWLGSLTGVDTPGPILSFMPIILMAVLFGLAMDYEDAPPSIKHASTSNAAWHPIRLNVVRSRNL